MRFNQIIQTPQAIDEVKMSPNRIDQAISSIEGVVAGFEAELCFTGALQNRGSSSSGNDYSQDERTRSIRQIIEFFGRDNNSSIHLDSLEKQLNGEYLEWRKERIADNLKNIEKSIGPVGLIMAFKEYSNNTHNTARTKIFNIDDIMVKLLVANNSGSSMSKEQAENIVMAGDDHYMSGDYSDWDDTSGKEIYYYNEAAQEALEYIEERLQNPIEALRIRDTAQNLIATNNIINGFFKETIGDTDYKITQGEWLDYMEYNAMSDIEREYAIYWPYDSYDSDDSDDSGYNSEDAGRIGDSMSSTLGVQVKVSSDYHSITRRNDLWIIEPDGSLTADEDEDLAAEIISPPMPLEETLHKINEFFTWAKSQDAYSNESTGFHVGVSFPDIGGQVDYVKLALFLGDEYVLKAFGRESNRYAKSAVSKIRETFGDSDASVVKNIIDELKNNLDGIAQKLPKMAGAHGKYTSINMKGDYIEFRSMGNDYVNQVPLIVETIKRYVYAMYIASQPDLHTREYATKLYKILGNSIQDDASTNKFIELFAKFNAGEIDKGTLISKMIPVQIARNQNKTNTPVYVWEFSLSWTNNIFLVSAATKEQAVEYFKNFDASQYRWDKHDKSTASDRAKPVARSANPSGHIESKLK
jgi:hypothetical protein